MTGGKFLRVKELPFRQQLFLQKILARLYIYAILPQVMVRYLKNKIVI